MGWKLYRVDKIRDQRRLVDRQSGDQLIVRLQPVGTQESA
jgi:hypothetical protein